MVDAYEALLSGNNGYSPSYESDLQQLLMMRLLKVGIARQMMFMSAME